MFQAAASSKKLLYIAEQYGGYNIPPLNLFALKEVTHSIKQYTINFIY